VAFQVDLDACVLYPASLRDTLLRLAAAELYDLYWSEPILEEVHRNLIENAGITSGQADHLVNNMTAAFEGAIVPSEQITALEPAMQNDPKDRHVLAAAKAIGAEAVITTNLRHFPDEVCAPLGIDVIHPDAFLTTLYDIDPSGVRQIVEQQAADLKNPPMTFDEVVAVLSVVTPEFAKRLANG
jgi:predicted nucleic acid-binding protein